MKKYLTVIGMVSTLVLGSIGGHYINPNEVEKIVTNTIEVEKVVFKTINVPVVEEVDNGNLNVVLEHVIDNNGNVEYITNDLDDNEIDQIVDRIVFINEVRKLSVDAVEKDLFDKADFTNVNGTIIDEDDMERLRIDEDMNVSDINFNYKDITVTVTGEFEQEDINYEFSVDVIFKDGEYDELSNISIVEG